MNNIIHNEMEILWSSFDQYNLDEKLIAFERLKAAATKNNLPLLVEFLKSNRNDFWTRELLSEPISELGGIEYLSELFDALALNEHEGHDNDGFNHFLMELAWSDPSGCQTAINELLSKQGFKHREAAEWLLGFCE